MQKHKASYQLQEGVIATDSVDEQLRQPCHRTVGSSSRCFEQPTWQAP